MANKKSEKLVVRPEGGMFRDLVMRLKLIVRLMGDKRVNPMLKLLPIGSLIYLLFPFDLISVIPGVSALDDMAIVSLGAYMFIEFCPPDVVAEHMRALSSNMESAEGLDDVVDADAVEIDDRKN